MIVRHSKRLTRISQTLRRNMTKEEKHLWYDYFKLLDITVHRQYVIEDYVADFYIPCANIVVELDGSQHYEPSMVLKDAVRTERMERYGLSVVRFPNNAIKYKFREVCEYLNELIAKHELPR